jgi:antitoxin StbD
MQTQTVRPILADNSTSISELKKNPMAVVEQGDGFPVAVLNRNQPAFYCVPADAYEAMMDKLEDVELAALVNERQSQPEIEVSINDL